MFNTIFKALGKIMVSGIIAFAILTLFSFFYYNDPVNNINKDGATDVKRAVNVFYSQGREGFGWGKTNNDGFPNLFDYDDDMKIDILIMGSSHMEAFQVGMGQSAASRLNTLLENETVYNIGVSGHHFLICARNLRAALNKYQPTKYVVIETFSVSFADEKMASVLNEEPVDLQGLNHEGGIRGLLRRNPYLRLINVQIQAYANIPAEDIEDMENLEFLAESDTVSNEKLLNDLLCKMSVSAEEYSAKMIVAYHPAISIASDGTLNVHADSDGVAQFRKLCDDNGILFLDMSSRFKEEYENAYILPYGFFNTPVGSGHMNQYGHAMMAEELYKLILEDEQ